MWDITQSGPECHPSHIYKGHDSVVEDISWHCHHSHMFASVGDDRKMNIWDTRTHELAREVKEAHDDDVNAVDFSPFNEYLLATGGKDRVCKLWDMRNLSQSLYQFGGEKHSVSVVGKYSKRRRSNVAVIHVRIVCIGSFLFYCLLLNHSFQTNPNSITNCFQLFSLLQLTTTLLLRRFLILN